mmetsp:Transcript_8146/g.25144  ORF Transcript_8146/g.25144 Transcript_8146/m.25144 type:complete len:360 (-) Transcript_8146:66-1145(-)
MAAHVLDAGAFEAWRTRHVRFFRLHLNSLSEHYLSLDTSRMAAVYFCLVGLDALRALEATVDEAERRSIVEWVSSLQVAKDGRGGFRGGTSVADGPHVAMTYTALCVLQTLGDDFSGVNVRAIKREVAALQRDDGGFTAAEDGCERDVRFAYCACAVARLLRHLDSSAFFDADRLVAHIHACRRDDGGFGLAPLSEAHGGSTYCCVAALVLAGRAPDAASDPVVDWCARRSARGGGFCGRPNKPPDSCYAFWIGASLRALGAADLVDATAVTAFVFSCESKLLGGFAKFPTDAPPDLLHSFYSVCWLSWAYSNVLNPVDPLLGICAHRLDASSPPPSDMASTPRGSERQSPADDARAAS